MHKKLSPSYQPSLLQTAPKILVNMVVQNDHPLLALKQELDWLAIHGIFLEHLRRAGCNVDHGPGRPLDTELYVPLIVLMVIKNLSSREMESYLAENAVARIFIGWENDARMQVRDHSNIARICDALGEAGMRELNALIIGKAIKKGFADKRILSGDTTAQELPIGYPHEAGILKGLSERCLRALHNLKKKGKRGYQVAEEGLRTIIKQAKEYHLFAKDQAEKQKLLRAMVKTTEEAMQEISQRTNALGKSGEQVVVSAVTQLQKMCQVSADLLPQIKYWLRTGFVAKGKIIHSGITQARSIVRNKMGKKVEFGFQHLLCAIGGGYLFGKMIEVPTGETKMPMQALDLYQEVVGTKESPELFTYDRGGWSAPNVKKLKRRGVKKVGIQPKGRAAWAVSETDRATVLSLRGQMEGRIGTLKTGKYKFNKPKQRKISTLRAGGQRSILSYNMNKMMRDILRHQKTAA